MVDSNEKYVVVEQQGEYNPVIFIQSVHFLQ